MSDGRALLSAICANPEEDTPRLVYADWLDESASALPKPKRESVRMRAELIRVQCEFARLPPDEDAAETAIRRIELEDRADTLLANASRRIAWAKPHRPPVETGCAMLPETSQFVRGFPRFALGTVSDFLAVGETLFDISPVHTLLCRRIDNETADRFLAQPWLARVRRLATSTHVDRSVVNELTQLMLGSTAEIERESSEKLFSAPALANLEELSLSNWEFCAPGMPVASRALTNLKYLALSHGLVRDRTAYTRLGELLPAELRLREFSLSQTYYFVDELRELASLPQFQRLERLTLGTRGPINEPPHPEPAPDINAHGYPLSLGAPGVRVLMAAPFWKYLRCLRDRIGFDGVSTNEPAPWADAPPAPELRTLQLSHCFSDGGYHLEALAASQLLASVTTLDLSGTKFGDRGATTLAASPHLNRLFSLNLSGCGIGSQGVKALVEAPWAANLVRLNLGSCMIRKAGVDALTAPGVLPRLRRLDANGTTKSASEKKQLRDRFGDGVRF